MRAPRQLVVVGDDPSAPLASQARRMPAEVLAIVTPEQAAQWAAQGFSLFEGKVAPAGTPTAYDCRNFACRLPVTDAAALEA
jgi:uncharacterized protein YyaL (SSP411 family)